LRSRANPAQPSWRSASVRLLTSRSASRWPWSPAGRSSPASSSLGATTPSTRTASARSPSGWARPWPRSTAGRSPRAVRVRPRQPGHPRRRRRRPRAVDFACQLARRNSVPRLIIPERAPATAIATDVTWARHQQVPGPCLSVIPWRPGLPVAQAARTRVACGPFGPWVTSNSTCWFSSRLRKP